MLTPHVRRVSRRTAFTLVEILIVVVILGILAAAVIPQFTSAADDTRQNTAALLYRSVTRKISTENAKSGSIPAAIDATWFEGAQLPKNPFFHDTDPTVQTVSNNNLHPQNKTNEKNGTFWYNTKKGIFRIRVSPGADNNETIARYNAVNSSNITSLSQTN